MASVTCVPTDLLGTWTLTRRVTDRLAGETRHVEGTARLRAEHPGLVRWTEEGTMRWSGGVVPVARTLDVRRAAAGAWTVHFSDGRVFHPWLVGAEVDHPCGADHYRGLVSVAEDRERWSVTWHSRGPEKDYVLRTTHTGRVLSAGTGPGPRSDPRR